MKEKLIYKNTTLLKQYTDVFIVFCISFLLLLLGSVIYPIIPITYDEAWNFSELSSKGFVYSITQYPVPNNHIFFTAIQSLFIPSFFLPANPYLIRLPNVFFSSIFIVLIYSLFRNIGKKLIYRLLILLLILGSSYLFLQYFFIARGYLLATLLSFIGLYLLSNSKYYSASLLFILSVWTIPTFAFPIPFLYAFTLLTNKNRWKTILISLIIIFTCSLICYYPVFGSVLENSHGWTTFTYKQYIFDNIIAISNFGIITKAIPFSYIYLVLYIILFLLLISKQNRNISNLTNLIIYMNVSIVAYEGLIYLLYYFNLINLPFVRNSIFVFLYINLSFILLTIFQKNCGFKLLMIIVYIINSIFGYINLFTPKTNFPTADLLNQLKSNEIKEIVLTNKEDFVVATYLSQIYKVPLKAAYKIKGSHISSNMNLKKMDFIKLSLSVFSRMYNLIMDFKYFDPITKQKIFKKLVFPLMSTEQKSYYYIHNSNYFYKNYLNLSTSYSKEYCYSALLYAENNVTLLIPELIKLQMKGLLDKSIVDKFTRILVINQKYLDHIIKTEENNNKWVNLKEMSEMNYYSVTSFR